MHHSVPMGTASGLRRRSTPRPNLTTSSLFTCHGGGILFVDLFLKDVSKIIVLGTSLLSQKRNETSFVCMVGSKLVPLKVASEQVNYATVLLELDSPPAELPVMETGWLR